MTTPTPPDSPMESLFAAWLERVEAGEEADLEEVCREHPRHEAGLRLLHRRWQQLEGAWNRAGEKHDLADPLRKGSARKGARPWPLESEGPTPVDFSSGVLSRLVSKPPASTRYNIQDEVGHGGMGAVLRVWDEDLRRHLAMKVMLGKGVGSDSGDTPGVDPRLVARFLEEAQITGQLDHPGIVPVHELGLDAEGRVYFTMKLVQGRTLRNVFDELSRGEGGWTQTRVLGLILKVCEAMSYAHAKGVIHRDLKPANVMVGRYGEVYVMDWGLAKVLSREDDKNIRVRPSESPDRGVVTSERHESSEEMPSSPLLTIDGDVVGTPAYMPPEQARGDLATMGPHSDVYAVGAMLYHLLAGHVPYVPPGKRLSSRDIWEHVQEGPPHSLDKEASDAPAELVAICERAMARDVSGRYPEVSALSEDLSSFLEGRVVHAYETGAWAETRKWMQRNKPLAASLVAVVLAVVAGGLAFAVKADEATKAATMARQNEREAKDNLTVAQRAQAEEKAQRELAQQSEAEARKQQQRAEAETAKVLRLSDVLVLQELEDEAVILWPAHPDKIADLESWLVQARKLADRLSGHRETLGEMRAQALPWGKEKRAHDRETHPRAGELSQKESELENLIAQLEQGLMGEALETADERVAELEPEIWALTDEVESRRTWSFDTAEHQWHHNVLAELIANLEGLEAGLLAEDSIPESHGWSVPRRLAFAKGLEEGFAEGGEYADAWARALPAIRETYPGLDLEPQMGLVPIGQDPESGLWEFAHLMTGEPAVRGEGDELVLKEDTGVVLVLLRGGSFWMGAQGDDPDGRNYDPWKIDNDEGPVHEVELTPFLLSKYELTQAQWERVSGKNPSYYQWSDLAPTLLHPVEQVSWLDCMDWLPQAGLGLPTEAQWECAARAGTDTPWWTGTQRDSLAERHAVNVADRAAAARSGELPAIKDWPELDDGYPVHAPAGTYSANPFGLHEIHGNVWEWCLDGYVGNFYGESPSKDPLASKKWVEGSPGATGSIIRVIRGGSFYDTAYETRSANRDNTTLSNEAYNLGVRPARAVTE